MNRIRYRQGGSYPLTAAAVDETGAAVEISGPPSITILDGAGIQVNAGTPSLSGGVLAYNAPCAGLSRLDVYTPLWTGTADGVDQEWRTPFELVGDHIIEISDIRAYDRAF